MRFAVWAPTIKNPGYAYAYSPNIGLLKIFYMPELFMQPFLLIEIGINIEIN